MSPQSVAMSCTVNLQRLYGKLSESMSELTHVSAGKRTQSASFACTRMSELSQMHLSRFDEAILRIAGAMVQGQWWTQ